MVEELHGDLLGEEERPDASLRDPEPALVLLACSTDGGRTLFVVGVSGSTQALHSIRVVESAAEVILSATIGARVKGVQLDHDLGETLVRRVVWVTQVQLHHPLGRRAVVGAPQVASL
ncbi:MAG: hypothetical protein ACYDB3_01915 [Acidimicrobiales bacterium]